MKLTKKMTTLSTPKCALIYCLSFKTMTWPIKKKSPTTKQLLTAKSKMINNTSSSSPYTLHMKKILSNHNNLAKTTNTSTVPLVYAKKTVKTSTKMYTYSSPNKKSPKKI